MGLVETLASTIPGMPMSPSETASCPVSFPSSGPSTGTERVEVQTRDRILCLNFNVSLT